MHDDGRQESQRGEGDRLSKARQRRHTEVAQAVAHERFEIPRQPEQRGHHQEAVDAAASILARLADEPP